MNSLLLGGNFRVGVAAIAVTGLLLFVPQADAQNIVTQWNFNNGSLSPSLGSGTANAIGGTTANFITGSGSSDPTQPGKSLALSNFPSSGASGTAGADFLVNTSGLKGIVVSFDITVQGAAADTYQFEYTTNGGSSWTDFGSQIISPTNTNPWLHVTENLAGLGDNSSGFGFEVVSIASGGGGTYQSADGISTYSGSAIVRLDMATVTTTTPEPASMVLAGLVGLSGLGGYGWQRLRQRRVA